MFTRKPNAIRPDSELESEEALIHKNWTVPGGYSDCIYVDIPDVATLPDYSANQMKKVGH